MNNNDDFFGGMFDFDGDGKTDIFEELYAYHMFEELSKSLDNKASGAPVQTESKYRELKKTEIPDNPTELEYRAYKGGFRISIIISIGMGIVFSILPIIILRVAYSTYTDSPSGLGLVFFIVVGCIAMVVLGCIWWVIGREVLETFHDLDVLKANYRKNLSEKELDCEKKKAHRGRIILISCIAAIVIMIIVLTVVVPVAKTVHDCKSYDQAVALVDEGSFEDAKAIFETIEIEDYKDTESYIYYCKSRVEYDNRDLSGAYCDILKVNFSTLTSEQIQDVEEYTDLIYTEYDARNTEMSLK